MQTLNKIFVLRFWDRKKQQKSTLHCKFSVLKKHFISKRAYLVVLGAFSEELGDMAPEKGNAARLEMSFYECHFLVN